MNTTTTRLKNMMHGVVYGYTRQLTLVGVGYRCAVKGQLVELRVGACHPIYFTAPLGVTVESSDKVALSVSGCDKDLVTKVAADIRKIKPPEVYTAKGIRYADEVVIKKEGKKRQGK